MIDKQLKLFLGISIFFALVVIGTWFVFFYRDTISKTPSEPSVIMASPKPEKLSIQKTVIGQTTEQGILNQSNLVSQEAKNAEVTEYTFTSTTPQRPNIIITQKGVAIFERNVLVINPEGKGFTTIEDIKTQLGEPQEKHAGSKFYGPFFTTYLYPNKGVAFIANENTDTIYEIQTFTPIPLKEYKKLYGEDLGEVIIPNE